MGAKKAFGTQLKAEVTTPGTFVAIAGITNIKPYSRKADIIDGTSHDSASETREKLPGLLDNGECQVDLNYNNENTGHIWLDASVGLSKSFKIVFPGATTPNTAAFTAIVKGFDPAAPHDGKLTASVVLDITGVISWT